MIFSIRVPDRGEARALASYAKSGIFDDWVWYPSESTKSARTAGILNPLEERMCDLLEERDLAGFLELAVTGQLTTGILGNTGSGKTTLAKAMCALIPLHERIITIEDSRELLLPKHPFTYHLLYEKKPKEKAKVTAADLIGASMRLFPTRVLLGELRGSEAWDFLKLVTTVRGCITTFHASSLGVAAERLAFMAKEHQDASTADLFELKRFALDCFDVMLHVSCDELFDTSGHVSGLKRRVTGVWYDPGAKRMKEHRG
jgi:type IV secretion system protein VirB11